MKKTENVGKDESFSFGSSTSSMTGGASTPQSSPKPELPPTTNGMGDQPHQNRIYTEADGRRVGA